MNAFKKQCVELRVAGYTLAEIVKATGRPKTSVYTHIYNIPLNQDKLRVIKIARGARAREIALARRGKSEKDFKKFTEWNTATTNLIAHLLFDGTISRTSCVYNNRNVSLLNIVEKHMENVYGYEPKRWFNVGTGVSRISYHNVALASYLETKSKELIRDICFLPRNIKKEFIRAFFDDEGCVDFRPKRNLRQIRGYQKDTSVLILIKKLLSDLEIESRVVKPNEVVISKKENLIKFQKEIGFSNGVKLNGNRSNSIWKKPLEKRIILEKAIKSFKN